MQLVCPAGSLPALKAAVNSGADAVYIGFKDETNARHFTGLNFSDEKAQQSIRYARERGVQVYLAINTYSPSHSSAQWYAAVDRAAALKVDALICADIGVMNYAKRHYPNLPLHLSVQASATNAAALEFYYEHFNIKRAVLPRVLSFKQVKQLAEKSSVGLEVFAFGSLCIMAEGRCYLSSYVTGQSPNNSGVCSPAKCVQWVERESRLESRLNNYLIDSFEPGESAGYPTLCKGRFQVQGRTFHAMESPTSLNTIDLIPQLSACGIQALKIEGRQRSPSYIAKVVRVWREALDDFALHGDSFSIKPQWRDTLSSVSEGRQTTLGAYERAWQ